MRIGFMCQPPEFSADEIEALLDNAKVKLSPEAKSEIRKNEIFKREETGQYGKVLADRWTRIAFGLDLIQKLPELDGEYSKEIWALDSGIRLENNPLSGDKLRSLNKDSRGRPAISSHGTHVLGTIASPDFGVNPRLNARVKDLGTWGDDINHDLLINALNEGAASYDVDVISLSLGGYPTNDIVAAIEKVANAGKIIVFAAGNEAAVDNIYTDLLKRLRNIPNVFMVGSLSSLGGKSFFTNYGGFVDFYAPGSNIESLNADYNPSIKEEGPSTLKSGTSMATPFSSAVLATLKKIDPALSGVELRTLVQKTAIKRGKPEFSILNPFLAIKVAALAKNCRAEGSLGYSDCVEIAMDEIQKNTPVPEKPSVTNCQNCTSRSVRDYFDALREYYFIEQGSELAAKLLDQFYYQIRLEESAERMFFSFPDSKDQAKRLVRYKLDHEEEIQDPYLSKDLKAAVATFRGEFEAAPIDPTKKLSKSEFFTVPSSHPDAVSSYQKYCGNFLKTYERMESAYALKFSEPDPCLKYLITATVDFRMKLLKSLRESDFEIQNELAIVLLAAVGGDDPDLKKAITQVLKENRDYFKRLIAKSKNANLIRIYLGTFDGDTPENIEKGYLEILEVLKNSPQFYQYLEMDSIHKNLPARDYVDLKIKYTEELSEEELGELKVILVRSGMSLEESDFRASALYAALHPDKDVPHLMAKFLQAIDGADIASAERIFAGLNDLRVSKYFKNRNEERRALSEFLSRPENIETYSRHYTYGKVFLEVADANDWEKVAEYAVISDGVEPELVSRLSFPITKEWTDPETDKVNERMERWKAEYLSKPHKSYHEQRIQEYLARRLYSSDDEAAADNFRKYLKASPASRFEQFLGNAVPLEDPEIYRIYKDEVVVESKKAAFRGPFYGYEADVSRGRNEVFNSVYRFMVFARSQKTPENIQRALSEFISAFYDISRTQFIGGRTPEDAFQIHFQISSVANYIAEDASLDIQAEFNRQLLKFLMDPEMEKSLGSLYPYFAWNLLHDTETAHMISQNPELLERMQAVASRFKMR